MNILIPDSWLREYLKTDATSKQIKESLSLCGPTVESLQKIGNDIVYNIEITSNRVDMASIYGIAREASAILPRFGINAQLLSTTNYKLPTINYPAFPMDISDPEKNCNRILGVVMDIDSVKPSPKFVKDRLEKSGIRALNNLVDITNYVMLELGHPSHVFDYDRIKTHKFIIRRAKKSEPIITLDSKKYFLSDEDVIIDDGEGRVIDLPGIMGTENSVVNENTKRIIFFIESNKPEVIRKTSMRYGIRTMAATINEKYPDPELAKIALLRGIELYKELAGGKIKSEIIDIYPNKSKPKAISVSVDFINDRLGIKLKPLEITEILKSLGFQVAIKTPRMVDQRDSSEVEGSGKLEITPPTFRQFDIEIPEDIVEEVARIYGYHNLPSEIMSGKIPLPKDTSDGGPKGLLRGGGIMANPLPIEEKIKTILKYWGFTETYHYSFVSEKLLEKVELNPKEHLKVSNPLSKDSEYMRTSLIPSLLETIEKNQHYKDNLQLFELSKVYIPKKATKTPGRWPKDSLQVEGSDLPQEISMLCIVSQKDFYHLKGIVKSLLFELGIKDYSELTTHNPQPTTFFHPLQTLQISKDQKLIATIGTLYPFLTQSFNIKNPTYIAYLNVELLVKNFSSLKHFTPIPFYPPIIEDITLPIRPMTPIGPIIDKIYKTSSLVKNVELVGIYKNRATLRLTFQDPTKNL
ncbi:phenylalanine--tRNA ligase subunit beta, partial [Candidatus Gottesmanbacteria bacterium]|nr:phenylalanine--tRNA ligase subunit beta [Candidatus Gottesmanbacteria bacterium]